MYKKLKNVNNMFECEYKERMIKMATLNQVELQNLRHLIGAHDTSYQKLNTYASQCVDPQIKQMFTKAAQDSLNTKQKLMTFLN
jgi:hypothetical protein